MNLRALQLIVTQGEWAIDESWHQLGRAIIEGDTAQIEALLAKRGDAISATTERRGDVGVIHIHGAIYSRGSLMADLCDAPTSESILREFAAALNDISIKSIILDIDSPGGVIAGIAELSDAIWQARGIKPVIAYAGYLAASAAYWIASAADEIVINKTASVGSIGVVAGYRKNGDSNVLEFVSSKSPKKRMNPESESGRAAIQAQLDALAQVFIDDIARNRKINSETVENDFGQGGLLVGQAAVEAGMADRLGSLEGLITELASGKWKKPHRKMTAGPTADSGENKMADKTFWERISARLGGKNDDATVAEAVTAEAEAAEKRAAQAEAEAERLRAEIAKDRTARIAADADAFIAAQIKAGKLLPAESADVREELMLAAADDQARPVAAGTKSRAERIRERIESRKSHALFEDKVPAASLKLPADPGGQTTEDTEKRTAELLRMTPQGQRALELAKSK